MPTFEYTALNQTGDRVAGALAGASEHAVLAELESRRLTPVSVREARPRRPLLRLRRGVAPRRLAETYLQLADMLRAGVPLLRALRLLSQSKSNRRVAEVFRTLTEAVAEGQELADALGAHPDVFKTTHLAVVRAGEKGGFLEAAFERLGEYVTKQAEMRSKIIGSLIYPAVIVAFFLVLLVVLFTVFIPMFEPMFARLDRVPALSAAILGAGDLFGRYGVLTFSALAAGSVGLLIWARNPAGKRTISVATTRAPVLGRLVRAVATGRFARLLGTLLQNGVPMLSAMAISQAGAGNALLEDAIDQATEAVRAGEPLAPPLTRTGLFDPDIIEMIAVGEESGSIAEVLLRIADTIEGRIDRLLATVIKVIEPLLIGVIAITVGVVAVGLLLPLLQLSDIR